MHRDPERTRRALLEFYDRSRRPLPWRQPSLREDGRADAYRVWVSEVMLQQTRVDAVVPYYLAWMDRFPTVRALAAAPLDEVLRAWEGLGYYARARNLHRAAAVVRDRLDGEIPGSAEALRALPGVGEYTAGAVASIAFGEAVPAVDGNVRRVLARLHDEAEPAAGWLRARATALVDPERPGDLNQALMELGATVCTPRAPRCGECPLRDHCEALARGTVSDRPRPKRRAPLSAREFGVAVLARSSRSGTELLLRRSEEEGMLGGLWQLPTAPLGDAGAEAAAANAARGAGAEVRERGRALPPHVRIYSHFRGIYHPFLWPVAEAVRAPDGWIWAGRAELERLALSAAHRAITRAALGAVEPAPPPP